MLQLKTVLNDIDKTQGDLARFVGVSPAAICQVVNHGMWPKRPAKRALLQEKILSFLTHHGVVIAADALKVDPLHAHAAGPDGTSPSVLEDEFMLLRKQVLTPAAKKAFGVIRDPFADLQSAEDMWVSPDIRYVRECMYQTARHGGLLAVIGESGAGKSTLRRDLVNRLESENQPVIMIEPYVLSAEDNDRKGKTLKSTHLAEAILSAVAPLQSVKSSPQARFAQLHRALKDSHASGYKHCMIIEEAHSLPLPTLKHLKRIMELEQGFQKLVSIILVGQPELNIKLSERNAEVREVVQRCEIVALAPIDPAELTAFLGYRFQRSGLDVGRVIDDSGIQAITDRLVSNNGASQLYPLAVGNFVAAAMNLAATLGENCINADIIQGV